VGAREKSRLKGLLSLGQGALQIEGADDAVLGRPEGEVDNRDRDRPGLRLSPFLPALPAIRAERIVIRLRITVVGAAHHHPHLW